LKYFPQRTFVANSPSKSSSPAPTFKTTQTPKLNLPFASPHDNRVNYKYTERGDGVIITDKDTALRVHSGSGCF
jgi:hypothetical protein